MCNNAFKCHFVFTLTFNFNSFLMFPEGAPSGTLGTRDNFKGCIRNVVIGKNPKDWTDMTSLNNILLSSCPVSL
jgi:hypothetical protein